MQAFNLLSDDQISPFYFFSDGPEVTEHTDSTSACVPVCIAHNLMKFLTGIENILWTWRTTNTAWKDWRMVAEFHLDSKVLSCHAINS